MSDGWSKQELAMPPLSTSISIGFLSLDWWSNPYVGAHWLAMQGLPDKQWQAEPHHGPLSQLLLLASHQLVELMLFRCIGEVLTANSGKFPKHEKKLPFARFEEAFQVWPSELGFAPFNLDIQPFASIKRLQERRNATIHKDAALASIEMGRSALHSAVEASRSIALHFRGQDGFPYERVLNKYQLPIQPWFTDVAFIERVK